MQRSVQLIFITVLFSFATFFSSCEDCQTCDKVGSDESREFCEEEIDLAEESDNWDC